MGRKRKDITVLVEDYLKLKHPKENIIENDIELKDFLLDFKEKYSDRILDNKYDN